MDSRAVAPDHRAMVVCALADDPGTSPADVLTNGCELCGALVYVTPASIRHLTTYDAEIVCRRCARALLAEADGE